MNFESFNSIEQMLNFLDQHEKTANDNATDAQRRITYGDVWMRIFEQEEVIAFGRNWTVADLIVEEILYENGYPEPLVHELYEEHARTLDKAFTNPDISNNAVFDFLVDLAAIQEPVLTLHDTTQEWMSSNLIRAHDIAERYQRGYRFGIVHSPIVPNGELGDTHIAVMVPLTHREYQHAFIHGWDYKSMFNDKDSPIREIFARNKTYGDLFNRVIY